MSTTLVQKFGGTSLGNADRLKNVAQIIEHSARDHNIIAVVSAMSSYTKEEGTTSRLLQAGNLALSGGSFYRVIDAIEETHFDALETAINNPEIQEEIKEYIHHELRTLKSFLEAIHVIREISPRSQDVIVGTGERLSACLLAGVLKDRGVDACYVNLSEVVSEGSSITDKRFYPRLRQNITQLLPGETSTVPVVTGYFGFVRGGIIDSVGRGYTDLTAALIAAEINAQELQIWKEVDGIFTADPRKVSKAHVLEYITPAEAAELTYFGSQVLHPFTMEQAIKAAVPIRIKNTFAPEKPGTVILPKNGKTRTEVENKRKRTAVAVTTKDKVSVVNIHSNRMLHSAGFLAKVFNAFQQHRIVLDLISTSEVNISCSVDKSDRLEELTADLEELADITLVPDRAILSLVGEGMKYVPGIAGRLFTALAEHQINIEMITQGASEINISCVIKQEDSLEALKVIHKTFVEEEE